MSPELTEFSDMIDEQFDIADMDIDDFVSYILSLFAWLPLMVSDGPLLSGTDIPLSVNSWIRTFNS